MTYVGSFIAEGVKWAVHGGAESTSMQTAAPSPTVTTLTEARAQTFAGRASDEAFGKLGTTEMVVFSGTRTFEPSSSQFELCVLGVPLA